MSLDTLTDPQVAALLVLCAGAANADLAELDEPAIQSAYGWPVKPGRTPGMQFPALAIYRGEQRHYQRTFRHAEVECAFTFEFWAPPTPLDAIEARWPLLHKVWGSTLAAVLAGHHESVASDALLLSVAGIVDVVLFGNASPRVRYQAPDPEGTVMPSFLGVMTLRHRTEIDTSALADLLSLAADVVIDSGSADSQPTAQVLVETA